MQATSRQDTGRSYPTASIARNNVGMSFAAQARAHELQAFQRNQDRSQTLQQTTTLSSLNVASASGDGSADISEDMGRRQRWRTLDLYAVPEPSPPTESETASAAASASASGISPDQNTQQLDPANLDCTSTLRRKRSESKITLLVNATEKRRARSGEHDDLKHSPTDSEPARRPSPFETDQSQQSLESEYVVLQNPLPAAQQQYATSVPRPPSYYPAVKGTSTDQQQQTRPAERPAPRPALPPPEIPQLVFRRPSNPTSNSWGPSSTQQTLSSVIKQVDEEPTDPFESDSSPIRERLQELGSWPVPAAKSGPLASFVRKSLQEVDAERKAARSAPAGSNWFEEDGRFDRETHDTVARALRQSSRSNSVSVARPAPIGAVGGRRPVFGGYVFSTSPDRSFEMQEQDDSDDVFHRVILPVMANMKSYSTNQKDCLNPFVKAPDWTIDHSPAGQTSFFGEDWGTPPPRVGRDPRYRTFQQEPRSREGFGNFSEGFQSANMQTPLRTEHRQIFTRSFQDHSAGSSSSQHSGQRGFRTGDDGGGRRWNAVNNPW